MTDTQDQEPVEIDESLLASIDARRKACNAKEALARSRLAFQAASSNQHPASPTTNAPAPSTLATGESSSAAPADLTGGSSDPDRSFLEWGSSQAAAGTQKPTGKTEIDDNDPSQWPDEISMDTENDEQQFADIKFKFDCILQPTIAQQINFEREKLKEEARKKRVASRMALEANANEQEKEQDALFCEPDQAAPTTEDEPKEPQGKKPEKPKAKGQNKPNAAERRRSKKLGLDVALGKEKLNSKARDKNRKAADRKGGSSKKQKKKDEETEEPEMSLNEMLQSNVLEEAHISSSMQTCPGFTQKAKDKALTELIASIPTLDQNEAKSDKKKILEAIMKFNNPAKSDGNGGWKVNGLKTSLYNYQLLGAAFMRDRENMDQAPRGGLLCDMMGFGKTIQALANMVDGRQADVNDPVKTTLIVVPSHLVTHWVTQITKHCDKDAIGRIIQYHAKSRMVSTTAADTAQVLQDMGVIITTYEEVRRSYPQIKIPKATTDPEDIAQLWDECYEHELGPLHRIKFLRIVLDEGHLIRNHTSSVSIAVRALTAKYKWILSGTPMLNYAEEFYAQLDFLEVPYIGAYSTFVRKYCEGKESRRRLVNLLRSFMFRRTHASRLFSLPIISLPDISERVVEVGLCAAERKIYDAIKDVFIDNINGLSTLEDPKMAQYRCFLTMILLLRMFSSHTLTAQTIVKRVLTPNLLNQLSGVSRGNTANDLPSKKITRWLVALSKNAVPPAGPPHHEAPEASSDGHQGNRDELTENFHKFMAELHEKEQWEERLERTQCAHCTLLPESPVLTDCKHMYCAECFHMLEEKEVDGAKKRVCLKKCRDVIGATTLLGTLENVPSEVVLPTSKDILESGKPQKKKKKKKRANDSANTGSAASDNKEDEADEKDWIKACGCKMPSAKLTKITEIVSAWIQDNPQVKVVVFTQFLGFIEILAGICQEQHWRFACLIGTMSVAARDESLKVFQEDDDVRVLIASLKAGGVGLDMSMASKCILVDLWWNEGIQQQAFCRLLRIGQMNTVEVVKLIATETIDDYMHRLQTEKTEGITKTMGEDVLAQRDNVFRLIEMFAEVTQLESGGFTIQSRKQ